MLVIFFMSTEEKIKTYREQSFGVSIIFSVLIIFMLLMVNNFLSNNTEKTVELEVGRVSDSVVSL